MSKLDIHHPAMRIDQSEGVELARIARVSECAEVAPVDFEPFPGHRLHAHKGAAGRQLRTHFADIFLEDAVPAAVTEWAQPLFNNSGRDLRIFLQPFRDVAFERIEFARTVAERRSLRRRFEVLADRSPAHFQMALDFADGPALGPVKPVQVVDLFGIEHPLFLYAAGSAATPAGCCLQDGGRGNR